MSATTTQLQASPNPAVAGSEVSLNAEVACSDNFNLKPPGSVTFKEGDVVLGTAVLATTAEYFSFGSLKISSLAAGSHQITAEYPGNADFDPSVSAAVTLVVSAVQPPPSGHGHGRGKHAH